MVLDVEADAMGIFPLLIPLSALSLVRINLVKLEDELPIRNLKYGLVSVPMNMSTSSLSVSGG